MYVVAPETPASLRTRHPERDRRVHWEEAKIRALSALKRRAKRQKRDQTLMNHLSNLFAPVIKRIQRLGNTHVRSTLKQPVAGRPPLNATLNTFSGRRKNVLHTCLGDMVDKRVKRNENHMDVFALYSHTMLVSILSS